MAFSYFVLVRWIQVWTKWIVILVSAVVCLVAVALVKLLFFIGLVIITRRQQNLAFLVGDNESRFSRLNQDGDLHHSTSFESFVSWPADHFTCYSLTFSFFPCAFLKYFATHLAPIMSSPFLLGIIPNEKHKWRK